MHFPKCSSISHKVNCQFQNFARDKNQAYCYLYIEFLHGGGGITCSISCLVIFFQNSSYRKLPYLFNCLFIIFLSPTINYKIPNNRSHICWVQCCVSSVTGVVSAVHSINICYMSASKFKELSLMFPLPIIACTQKVCDYTLNFVFVIPCMCVHIYRYIDTRIQITFRYPQISICQQRKGYRYIQIRIQE